MTPLPARLLTTIFFFCTVDLLPLSPPIKSDTVDSGSLSLWWVFFFNTFSLLSLRLHTDRETEEKEQSLDVDAGPQSEIHSLLHHY